LADAPAWSTPSLLLYAGTDRLVDPRGSTRFAAQAPAACVQAHVFETMYHEIFNDPEAAQVFDVLIPWLTQRF
jgi:alpha-beta hydrolase superfamily lysophospholipase